MIEVPTYVFWGVCFFAGIGVPHFFTIVWGYLTWNR